MKAFSSILICFCVASTVLVSTIDVAAGSLIPRLSNSTNSVSSTGSSGSPRLHHKRFGYNGDIIRGVNLGGWLVLEPWIRPSLFLQFYNYPKEKQPVDEWSFCQTLGKEQCYVQLKHHWDEWFTPGDIGRLAMYGINHIRIPIGYWAFSPSEDEPFVQGQVEYLEKAIRMAKDVGINVIIDLHGTPGSQNGFDNSGIRGGIHWQDKENNVQRTLTALEELAKVANKYGDTVDIIEYVNEPANWGLDMKGVVQFYNKAYATIREIMPNVDIMLHDSFLPLEQWHDLRNPDWQNTLMDTHIYHVFTKDTITLTRDQHIRKAQNDGESIAKFNPTLWTVAGEWSLATTDCTMWLNGHGKGARWDGSLVGEERMCAPGEECSCTGNASSEYQSWTPDYWQFLKDFARAQIEAYERGVGWIFWNFKTENSPQWDYTFCADHGIIPYFPKNK
ncbi:hypothetical protein H4219_005564 [Mycoemilia scoparia]|uniref:glucan 1,3-beta-glucosidase n=1 Tax=Mycoemilia scoparia TaxID=417184 RepID=A0A9W8DKV0_9FUNG|nr:hypothetical protein H4219_005564 [Mycoemilia scoparia]